MYCTHACYFKERCGIDLFCGFGPQPSNRLNDGELGTQLTSQYSSMRWLNNQVNWWLNAQHCELHDRPSKGKQHKSESKYQQPLSNYGFWCKCQQCQWCHGEDAVYTQQAYYIRKELWNNDRKVGRKKGCRVRVDLAVVRDFLCHGIIAVHSFMAESLNIWPNCCARLLWTAAFRHSGKHALLSYSITDIIP